MPSRLYVMFLAKYMLAMFAIDLKPPKARPLNSNTSNHQEFTRSVAAVPSVPSRKKAEMQAFVESAGLP